MSRVIFVFVIFLFSGRLAAQDSTTVTTAPLPADNTESYQKERVSYRKFNKEKWKQVTQSNKFQEEAENQKDVKKPTFKPSASWSLPTGIIFKVIAFTLIAAFVIFVFYYILKNIEFGEKTISKTVTISDASVPVENIVDLDIPTLLQQAIAAGNYKLAVRLYYLRALRILDESGKIDWRKEKTNRDYLNELFVKSWYFEEMRSFTRVYEQVWYGEHALSAESFQLLRAGFESLNHQISPS